MAAEVLTNVFEKIMPEDASQAHQFFSGWDRLVGQPTAFHVHPVDIVNGTLILEADHPGWIQRLRLVQGRLMGELKKKYPELGVKRIRITVGDGLARKKTASHSVKPSSDQEIGQKRVGLNSENSLSQVEAKKPPVSSEKKTPTEDAPFFALLDEMKKRGTS